MPEHQFKDAFLGGVADTIAQAVEEATIMRAASVADITTRSLPRTQIIFLLTGAGFSIYKQDPLNTNTEDGVTLILDNDDLPFARIFNSEDAGSGGGGAAVTARFRTTANVDLAGGGLAAGTVHDGVTAVAGDVVLVPAQTAGAENGLYSVPASGAASRVENFNTYDEHPGAFVTVQEGTLHEDTRHVCTSDEGGTLDTDPIVFADVTGAGDVFGPASATDNALARFDTTTGKLIQNSVGVLDDSGNLSGIANIRETLTAARTYYVGFDLGTCTMTIASPAVVTKTAHGLAADDRITFSTTGALPTGVTEGQDYYVLATGLTANTFQFSATSGGAAVNTSGSQSGTHSCRTGSDTNDGLTNSAAGAFLTIQTAVDAVAALDLSIYDATIQIADGTWTPQIVLKSTVGAGKGIIKGDSATPSNVLLSVTSADAVSASGIMGHWELDGLKIQTTTSGHHINCGGANPGFSLDFKDLDFGASGNFHIVNTSGAYVRATGDYTISGAAQYHYYAVYPGSTIEVVSRTVTVSGTPAFSVAFASARITAALRQNSITFSGTATGKRYDVIGNGVIFTNGGGASYYPGDVAGTTATGGQYL